MAKKVNKTELIGQNIKIIKSKNISNIGLEGKIIDETKNTLRIRLKESEKKLIKKNIIFTIQGKIIKGDEINLRPEERIKLK